jgi:hypothetical protein
MSPASPTQPVQRAGINASGRKPFFFEKRTKKLYVSWPSPPGTAKATTVKGFLLLFFNKEVLPSLR